MRFGRETTFSPRPQSEDKVSEVSNPLLAYFNAHKEGAGIWKWMHYFDIYQRHFHKFAGREVHVLEVGIYGGGSLSMWREYFGERCHVYGVEIDAACMAHSGEKTKVFIGDQADRVFWAKVKKAVDWRFTETPYKSIFETAPKRYRRKSPDPSAEDFCTSFGTTRGEPCRIKTEWKPTQVRRSIWI